MSFAESNDGQPKLMPPAFFATKTSSGEPRACLGGDRVESDAVIDLVPEASCARRQEGRIPDDRPPTIDSQPVTALPPSRTAPLVQATGGMNVLGGTVNISGPITFGSSPMQGILN